MNADPNAARNQQNRKRMLAALRGQSLEPVPLPESTGPWIRYMEPREQFRQVLESVGGQLCCVGSREELLEALYRLPAYVRGIQRCCGLDLPGEWTVDLHAVTDPHQLADLDLAVLPGEFAVAENGAVWVSGDRFPHRAVCFIPQHLVLVVASGKVLHNLHEAYAHLEFAPNRFGCFISGPSKTADIEQSLVIGAHGARSLTVFLLPDSGF